MTTIEQVLGEADRLAGALSKIAHDLDSRLRELAEADSVGSPVHTIAARVQRIAHDAALALCDAKRTTLNGKTENRGTAHLVIDSMAWRRGSTETRNMPTDARR